jgi:hypothetical protein
MAFQDGDDVVLTAAILPGEDTPIGVRVTAHSGGLKPCVGRPGVHLSTQWISGADGENERLKGGPFSCEYNNKQTSYSVKEAFGMIETDQKYTPFLPSGRLFAFDSPFNYMFLDTIPWHHNFVITAPFHEPDLWSPAGAWGNWWHPNLDYYNPYEVLGDYNKPQVDDIWRYSNDPHRLFYGAMLYWGIMGIAISAGIRFRMSVLPDFEDAGPGLSYDLTGPGIWNVWSFLASTGGVMPGDDPHAIYVINSQRDDY